MVGRLLLLLLVVLGVGLYMPDSRALLAEWARPLARPARVWMTNQELARIAEDFEIYMGGRGFAPLRRGQFDEWLDDRYPQTRSREDSWGTRYAVEVNRSGFRVISAGPDRAFRTSDDLAAEGSRE